jgi:hypothetical protein
MQDGRSNSPSSPAAIAAGRVAAEMKAAQSDYAQQVATFQDRIQRMGVAGLENYYWYHTVELGNGLVTPGDYDFRDQINSFGFPEDLRGKRVLDIGSATVSYVGRSVFLNLFAVVIEVEKQYHPTD